MTSKYRYQMPDACGDDPAGNMAVFLTINTGSCLGMFYGHIRAADQRSLFGRFLGKGRVTIDGEREVLQHSVKVCFGTDSYDTHDIAWRDLEVLS